ncbi:unnamed protein product [Rhizoctonia solani]|uniref:F-box domain-containing protein n=1 Tax=Rhizoctonia solani TaxID=456999 RepID=A0A8H3B137_9AGAM|nr:unnamed protein product [Rhizoctonia solani]
MEIESSPQILRLPDEIIIRLLHLCSYRTILSFARTCRQCQDLVVNTASLQLHIELDVSGMEIHKGSSTSTEGYPTMLNDIRGYRESWQNLDLEDEFQSVTCDISGSADWNTRGGVFTKTTPSNHESFETDLLIRSFGSTNHPIPLRFKQTFIGVAVDLSQDGRTYLNLVSSLTGHPHPAADLTTINVPFEECNRRLKMKNAAIVGEILSISFRFRYYNPCYEIFTWNWKTGDLLHFISGVGVLYSTSFLDQGHLAVLAGTSDNLIRKLRLSIYTVPDHSSTQSTPTTSETFIRVSPALQLDFPRLHDNVLVDGDHPGACILSQPDSIPGRPIQIGSTTLSYPRVPTLGIKLTLTQIPPGSPISIIQHFVIFICVDSLLHLVQSQRSGQSRVLPWSEWGVMNTRWFVNENLPRNWYTTSSITGTTGSRYSKAFDNDRRMRIKGGKEVEGDEDDEGGEDNDNRVTGKAQGDITLSVIDFKPSHWEKNLHQALTMKDQQLILHGRWPSPLLTYTVCDTTSEKNTDSLPNSGVYVTGQSCEAVPAIMVGSDTPTNLGEREGFDEPVESRLPYRLVARVKPVPQGACCTWIMNHDSVIGLQVGKAKRAPSLHLPITLW